MAALQNIAAINQASDQRAVTIRFAVLPPSANNLHRHHHDGNNKIIRVKSKPYAEWRKAAGWEILSQRPGQIIGPYTLEIAAGREWRMKRPRARDIDNIIKPISDALVAFGVVSDDSLCERVTAYWSDSLEGVAVTVTPLDAIGKEV